MRVIYALYYRLKEALVDVDLTGWLKVNNEVEVALVGVMATSTICKPPDDPCNLKAIFWPSNCRGSFNWLGLATQAFSRAHNKPLLVTQIFHEFILRQTVSTISYTHHLPFPFFAETRCLDDEAVVVSYSYSKPPCTAAFSR
jgi:hypothetical protein